MATSREKESKPLVNTYSKEDTSQLSATARHRITTDPAKKVLRLGVISSRRVARIDDERLIPSGKPVTIGRDSRNIFAFPSAKLPDTFVLFQPDKPGRYLLRVSEKMDVRISFDIQQETLSLSELKQAGKAVKKGDLYEIPIEGTTRGKVMMRGITLLFQMVPPPPPAVKPVLPKEIQKGILSQLDRVLLIIFLISFGIHATIGTIALTHVVPKLDPDFDEDNPLIGLLIKEQPLQVSVLPDDIEPEAPVINEEAPPEEVATNDKPKAGVGNAPKEAPVGNPGGKSDASNARNVGLAGVIGREGVGGAFQDLYGGSTDSSIDDAFDLAAGPTRTAGAGDDIGAGLKRGEGSGGEGSLADLGSDVGAKNTDTSVPSTPKKTEKKVTGKLKNTGTTISSGQGGALDSASIQRVVGRAKGSIQACYTRALSGNDSLEGKLSVQFSINEAGRVVNSSVLSDSINSSDVSACVLRIIKRLRFPENPGGGNVTAASTFVFTPTK